MESSCRFGYGITKNLSNSNRLPAFQRPGLDRACINCNFQYFPYYDKLIFAAAVFVARVKGWGLVKAVCERLSICRRSERDSTGTRRQRLCATVRKANAEIQPGNYFGLFDRVDNIARRVGLFIVKRTIAFLPLPASRTRRSEARPL
jgi:hypothetical protein